MEHKEQNSRKRRHSVAVPSSQGQALTPKASTPKKRRRSADDLQDSSSQNFELSTSFAALISPIPSLEEEEAKAESSFPGAELEIGSEVEVEAKAKSSSPEAASTSSEIDVETWSSNLESSPDENNNK